MFSLYSQVNQLKTAVSLHNESIQFLKGQNAELKDELGDSKTKVGMKIS